MQQRSRHLASLQWGPRRSPGRKPLHPRRSECLGAVGAKHLCGRHWRPCLLTKSRRDLPQECDEAESSSVRGYRGSHCPSGHGPRHVLARRKNQILEVDVTEEVKQVAYIAVNSPASYTTTMRSS